MTTTHTCLRCGLENRCTHGGWADRHPLAAVLLAVVALGSVCAYPWLLAVLAAAVAAYVIDREHRRRQALAARADWEHQALMQPPVRWAKPVPQQVISPLPTTPLRKINPVAKIPPVTLPASSLGAQGDPRQRRRTNPANVR